MIIFYFIRLNGGIKKAGHDTCGAPRGLLRRKKRILHTGYAFPLSICHLLLFLFIEPDSSLPLSARVTNFFNIPFPANNHEK